MLLFCGNFFQFLSGIFWVNGVFKCNKLTVHFKLTLGMVFVILYKHLHCTADKAIDTNHTTTTDCNTN